MRVSPPEDRRPVHDDRARQLRARAFREPPSCLFAVPSGESIDLSEVADRVGYQSLSWFGIAFKRQFGTLPSEIWPRTVKDLSSTDNAIR